MGAETIDEDIEQTPVEDMTPEERFAFLQKLRDANKGLVDELHRIPGLPPMSLGAQRIEMLIEWLWPWQDGKNEERVAFEVAWELRANRLLGEFLANIEAQMNRAKLLGGAGMPVPPPPGGQPPLVVPGS